MENTSPQDQFRSGIEDAVVIAKALHQHCDTIEEFIGMCELALSNEGQMRMLVKEVRQLKAPVAKPARSF